MKKTILLAFLFSSIALAQEGEHRGPPPEGKKPPFVTACEGKSAGDACTFTDRSGSSVTDKCQNGKNPRGDAELMCGTPPTPPARK